ncbi:Unknown protein, partial [Striga hermonthica]
LGLPRVHDQQRPGGDFVHGGDRGGDDNLGQARFCAPRRPGVDFVPVDDRDGGRGDEGIADRRDWDRYAGGGAGRWPPDQRRFGDFLAAEQGPEVLWANDFDDFGGRAQRCNVASCTTVIAYNLGDRDFNKVLTLHQDFKRTELMKEGNRTYSITYKSSYALSNTHHSEVFLRKEFIEVPRIFEDFAKAVLPDIIGNPTIEEIDMRIQDKPVFNRSKGLTYMIEPRRMSFQQDRAISRNRWEEQRTSIYTRTPD